MKNGISYKSWPEGGIIIPRVCFTFFLIYYAHRERYPPWVPLSPTFPPALRGFSFYLKASSPHYVRTAIPFRCRTGIYGTSALDKRGNRANVINAPPIFVDDAYSVIREN